MFELAETGNGRSATIFWLIIIRQMVDYIALHGLPLPLLWAAHK
jgi:hypothetical protein